MLKMVSYAIFYLCPKYHFLPKYGTARFWGFAEKFHVDTDLRFYDVLTDKQREALLIEEI